MTIAARRRTYWALFLSACACLGVFFLLYSQFSGVEKNPAFLAKSGALGTFRLGRMAIPSQLLAACGTGLCALYATLALGYILYSFRKTGSTEIYFFAFWVLSVGLEVIRLGVFGIAQGGARPIGRSSRRRPCSSPATPATSPSSSPASTRRASATRRSAAPSPSCSLWPSASPSPCPSTQAPSPRPSS